MGGDAGFISFVEKTTRKLDLLFMVDNSFSIEKAQANLQASFPRFTDVLKNDPEGLPDLHLAVVSSSMGAGAASPDIPGCTPSDNGVFHSGVGVQAACNATGLTDGARYISTTGGTNPQNNFTGEITQVFQCVAPIGASGCGYEQPLASVVRALGADGFQVPPENLGFLREDAYLGIVLLTNEDDCSSPDPNFYTIAQNSLSSPLGPSGNFRCVEFGHKCKRGGTEPLAPPQRNAPFGDVTATISYENCESRESDGMLTPVASFAAGIKNLKVDPAHQILVASIQGPTTPYQIHWKTAQASSEPPWPDPTHSCTGRDGSFADPGVRIQQFVQQFGTNGVVSSICADSFGPALETIAHRIQGLFSAKCITGWFQDADGDRSNGVQPICTVKDRVPKAGGGFTDTPITACAENGNTPPCWSLAPPNPVDLCAPPSLNGTTSSRVLQVNRGQVVPADDLLVLVKCGFCDPTKPDRSTGCI